MESPKHSPSAQPLSALSSPASNQRFLLPFLAGLAFMAASVFVYFHFFPFAPLVSSEDFLSGEVSVTQQDGNEELHDPVYQADYDEGYSAGYVDGRSVHGAFYDSYDEPASLERQAGYFDGYFAGFLRGCEEGRFDCSEIEHYRVDYTSGYHAGYEDGFGETSEFFDSYTEFLDPARQRSYLTGYFDGFLTGCDDAAFDCSEVAAYRTVYDEAYDLGYQDGSAQDQDFLDSYIEPQDDAFLGPYNEGYFDGFLAGCDEGGFDCDDISRYRAELEVQGDAGFREDDVSDVH